jgi:hypothetical protein
VELFPQSGEPIPGRSARRKRKTGGKIPLPAADPGRYKPPTFPDPGESHVALPIADWQASLDEMETTLEATLEALDRYRQAWERVLAEPTPAAPTDDRLARLEGRLQEWDARLAAAAELAASVERDLTDREATVARWREMFNGWRGLIEQR